MGNYTSALLLLARLMLACLYMISGVPKLLSFTGTIDKMASLGLIFPAITAAIVVLVEIVGALMIVFGFFTRPVSIILCLGNDSNLLIVFYVQIMPDDFVMQLHRF